jgi:opacity protein-like surface antigen
MKSFCLAALAAMSFAATAYAGDATAPKPMTDSEMDKVTAGAPPGGEPGLGIVTAGQTGPGFPGFDGVANAAEAGGVGQKGHIPAGTPMLGKRTAGQ